VAAEIPRQGEAAWIEESSTREGSEAIVGRSEMFLQPYLVGRQLSGLRECGMMTRILANLPGLLTVLLYCSDEKLIS
jgi:hypothetical protein